MLNVLLKRGVLLGGTLALLGGCASIPVTSDFNPNMTGNTCHTFAFLQEHSPHVDQPAAFGNPMNAERLRQAVEANLTAKGMQHAADHSEAECMVGYAMGTRQVMDQFYGSFGLGSGFGYGRYGFGGFGGYGGYGGFGYDGPFVRNETRIAVDLFDAKSRAPIWHGAVSQNVSELTGPDAAAKINAATAAIFSKFPGTSVPIVVPAAPATKPGATS